MSDRWETFLCSVNDRPASILVDVGLRETVPDLGKSWLLWAWVYFQKPRPDGLSSREEFETLVAIEDGLTSELQRSCGAVLSGRITTAGRREFYYYAAIHDRLAGAVTKCLAQFPSYRYDWDSRSDPDWRQYLDVLYPSDLQRQLISNRELLAALKDDGDTLEPARAVSHYVYFGSDHDRARFEQIVAGLGYRVESRSNDSGERPFGTCVVKTQSLSREQIDRAVTELFEAAKDHAGFYDGWESPVMTRVARPGKKPWWKLWRS